MEFEFKQKLTKEDIIKYNFFALRFNKGITFNMRFIGFLCLIAGVYLCCLKPSTYLYPIIIICLGLFCVFGIVPIHKAVIKYKVLRKEPELPEMRVIVGERGIFYDFTEIKNEDKDLKENSVIEWDMINRAILEDDLLYVFCSSTYIICIKKDACAEFDKMETVFIEKLGLNQRYFNQKNHFFLNKKS